MESIITFTCCSTWNHLNDQTRPYAPRSHMTTGPFHWLSQHTDVVTIPPSNRVVDDMWGEDDIGVKKVWLVDHDLWKKNVGYLVTNPDRRPVGIHDADFPRRGIVWESAICLHLVYERFQSPQDLALCRALCLSYNTDTFYLPSPLALVLSVIINNYTPSPPLPAIYSPYLCFKHTYKAVNLCVNH